MYTQRTHPESRDWRAVASPAAQAAVNALTGIERHMAEAFMALDWEPSDATRDPAANEYASWIRLLRGQPHWKNDNRFLP